MTCIFLWNTCFILLYRIIRSIKTAEVKTSPATKRELRFLGAGIREARLRRALPQALIAERASVSVDTLRRIECGDPAVSIGSYAMVLHAFGIFEGWGHIHDSLGDELAAEQLRKRAPKDRSRLSKSFLMRHGWHRPKPLNLIRHCRQDAARCIRERSAKFLARLGIVRLTHGGGEFQSPQSQGVPSTIALGDLLHAARRIESGDETEDDLSLIFAPGHSRRAA